MTAVLHVLGTAQDGGIPHAGCRCETCRGAGEDPARRRRAACVAVAGTSGKTLVVDATPDFPDQLVVLAEGTGRETLVPDAVLLTHAHLGHYVGLAYLGREAMDAAFVPLYATSTMDRFLRENRPWAHLVTRGQVAPRRMAPDEPIEFDGVVVTPFLSPHRAEDTDTVGVEIRGPSRIVLYLPDADVFTAELVERIERADVALVDGTFWTHEEVTHRDVGVIPHPEAKDSVVRLAGARGEVVFTHLNHTNPLVHPDPSKHPPLPAGFRVAVEGETLPL